MLAQMADRGDGRREDVLRRKGNLEGKSAI
jgi:hypothetical protein